MFFHCLSHADLNRWKEEILGPAGCRQDLGKVVNLKHFFRFLIEVTLVYNLVCFVCTTFCFCFDLPCCMLSSVQFSSVQSLSRPTLCDPVNRSMLTTKNCFHQSSYSWSLLPLPLCCLYLRLFLLDLSTYFVLFFIFHIWVKSYGSEIRFLKRETNRLDQR